MSTIHARSVPVGRRAGPASAAAMLALMVAMPLGGATSLAAQTGPLGCAQPFAVLGASTVTNTGPTTITGNLGLWPGTSFTTTGGLTLNGVQHINDDVAKLAQGCALSAYDVFSGMASTSDLTGQDLGNRTLTPGVYSFGSSAQLTGALTLDFLGNPNSLFVFLINSTLTTASSSSVTAINGAAGGGIFWNVGSSATLGTSTVFLGNILADQSITLNTSATILCGRAIALNAAVTMDQNVISNDCDAGDYYSEGYSLNGDLSTTVPEPSTLALLVGPLGVGLLVRLRRRNAAGAGVTPAADA